MFRLLAFHQGRRLEREFFLEDGRTSVLGRSGDCDIVTPWDAQISKRHVQLSAAGSQVSVLQVPGSANRIFTDGHSIESVQLESGQSFVIGSTRFELQQLTLSDSPGHAGGRPIQQLA
ncbi:MAG: FHA domain-containing protein, partial [Planctomycetota bacterium]